MKSLIAILIFLFIILPGSKQLCAQDCPVVATEVCGIQCCRYIFTVKCTERPDGEGSYVNIVNFEKQPYPGSECTGSDTDCLTGETIPCSSTCE